MANYAASDVKRVLEERDWEGWDELLAWLAEQPDDPQGGMSGRDRDELVRDLGRLRDEGRELTRDAGALYRQALGGG
jgi:hypothetical protein